MSGNIYSHSVLEAIEQCPEKGLDAAKLERYGKAGPARQGQWAHFIAHKYVEHLYTKKRDSDIEWGLDLVQMTRGSLSPDDEAGAYESAKAWVEDYSAEWLLDAQWVMFEQRVHVHIDAPGVALDMSENVSRAPIFAMTPDLVLLDRDDSLHILDYKNGWNTDHVQAPGQSRQNLRYLGPYVERFRPTSIFAHVEHMRWRNRETEEVDYDDVIGAWDAYVTRPIQRIEKLLRDPDRAPVYVLGAHCGDCDRRGVCPAYARFPGEVDDLSPEELVAAKTILGAKLNAVNARLKDSLAKLGSVSSSTHEARNRIDDKYHLTPAAVREVLAKHLPDDVIPDAFSATPTSIEALLKKMKMKPADRRAIMDEVKATGTVTKSAVLEVKRASVRSNEEGSDGTVDTVS